MKFLFDFFPIALFFIAYKMGDIYLATITAIVASVVQVLWSRYKTGRFEKLPLITLGTIVVLGGATLFFRNELFIKWKPTALYWVLALALVISQFIGNKPLMQRLLEQNVALPTKIWHQLNLSWALFFAAMGIANLYVVYHFDTDTWVNFKLFGTLGLTLVFIVLQGFYMAKHFKQPVSTLKNEE
ncbi:MAG TPA: septation protein A [Gammaproteobacteria bacterium]|nr:septation protein A [Gammaproteobacteria bacterium]